MKIEPEEEVVIVLNNETIFNIGRFKIINLLL